MKTNLIKPLVLSVIMIGMSSFTFAQKKELRPQHQEESIEKVTSVSGIVNDWTYNDDFIYDGFYLQTNSEKLFVKIPKHLGKEIRNSISNKNVTVNGVIRYSPRGEKEIKFISINNNGKFIYDIPKDKPMEQPMEKYISNSGKVIQFQQNDKGDMIGLLLTNKIILRIPPHKIFQLHSLVKIGDTVSFTGLEKPKNNDEAYVDNYSIINCTTITVSGEQYLIK